MRGKRGGKLIVEGGPQLASHSLRYCKGQHAPKHLPHSSVGSVELLGVPRDQLGGKFLGGVSPATVSITHKWSELDPVNPADSISVPVLLLFAGFEGCVQLEFGRGGWFKRMDDRNVDGSRRARSPVVDEDICLAFFRGRVDPLFLLGVVSASVHECSKRISQCSMPGIDAEFVAAESVITPNVLGSSASGAYRGFGMERGKRTVAKEWRCK